MNIYTLKKVSSFEDLKDFNGFLLEKKNKGNMPRSLEELLEVAIEEKLFMIEDKATNEVVAVSATFRHFDILMEFGAIRATVNGFGFQKVLMSAQVINEVLFDPEFQEIYCTVLPQNTDSVGSIEGAGFVKWGDPNPKLILEKLKSAEQASRSPDVLFYHIPREQLNQIVQKSAEKLLSVDGKVISHRSNGEKCKVELDLASLRKSYKPAVVKLANGQVTFSGLLEN